MGVFASSPCSSLAKAPGCFNSDQADDDRGLISLPDSHRWRRHYVLSKSCKALMSAVRAGDAILAEKQLKGLAIPDCADDDSVSPLLFATSIGRADLVQMLLAKRANLDPPGGGQVFDGPPLVLAAARGFTGCVEALLQARACPAQRAGRSQSRQNGLHMASSAGHAECLRLLLAADISTVKVAARGGDFTRTLIDPEDVIANAVDDTQRLPLHYAVENEHLACVDVLIREGFSFLDEQLADGEMALHRAAVGPSKTSSAVSLCGYLLTSASDANVQDLRGRTPLHLAAAAPRPRVCKLLLDHSADIHVAGGRHGRSALHCAAYVGCTEVCVMMMEARADVHAADDDQATPLTLAVHSGNRECVDVIALAVRGAERDSYVQRGGVD